MTTGKQKTWLKKHITLATEQAELTESMGQSAKLKRELAQFMENLRKGNTTD